MPSIDIPLKRLVQLCPGDWIKYLQPNCSDNAIRPFKTEYIPKTTSKLDNVFQIEDPNGTYIVNIEPMGYRDPALPARMMRYRSDIWEATINDKKGTPHILQTVIFFYPEDDNRKHLLTDNNNGVISLHFTYDVIKIWEKPRQEVLEQKLVGLYPLLPLMQGEPGEQPEIVCGRASTGSNGHTGRGEIFC